MERVLSAIPIYFYAKEALDDSNLIRFKNDGQIV